MIAGDVAQAVAGRIAALDLGEPFTARRDYVVMSKLDGAEERPLDITVVGMATGLKPLARGVSEYGVEVHVAVRMKIAREAMTAECDRLSAVVERLAREAWAFDLSALNARLLLDENAVEIDPAWVPEHLHDLGQFTARLRLRYAVRV